MCVCMYVWLWLWLYRSEQAQSIASRVERDKVLSTLTHKITSLEGHVRSQQNAIHTMEQEKTKLKSFLWKYEAKAQEALYLAQQQNERSPRPPDLSPSPGAPITRPQDSAGSYSTGSAGAIASSSSASAGHMHVYGAGRISPPRTAALATAAPTASTAASTESGAAKTTTVIREEHSVTHTLSSAATSSSSSSSNSTAAAAHVTPNSN